MGKILKPGQATPQSGIYDMVGPRGGTTGEQVVSTHNKPLPPTQRPGQGYVLSEPARHEQNKKR